MPYGIKAKMLFSVVQQRYFVDLNASFSTIEISNTKKEIRENISDGNGK